MAASWRRGFLPLATFFRRPRLKLQQDIAQLDPITVLQLLHVRHALAVDQGEVGRRPVVAEDIVIALALDEGMLLLDAHVSEEGDVRVLVPTQEVLVLVQRIFPAFLPATHHLDAGRLQHPLDESGNTADGGPEDDEPKRAEKAAMAPWSGVS